MTLIIDTIKHIFKECTRKAVQETKIATQYKPLYWNNRRIIVGSNPDNKCNTVEFFKTTKIVSQVPK